MAVVLVVPQPPFLGVFRRSPDGFNHLASRRYARSPKIAGGGRQSTFLLSHDSCDAGDMRVFVVSFLHRDYEENVEWVRRLSTVSYKKDGFHHLASRRCARSSKNACGGRHRTSPVGCSSHGQCGASDNRVFVVSDLHTDYEENMEWVRRLSTSSYKKDALIVAGDVTDKYDKFVLTMSELKQRFDGVFFVPGNHDLWCRGEDEKFMDSLEKLKALLNACSNLGIETAPRIIGGVGIIPLFSWYHKSFDKEKDISSVRIPPLEWACRDLRLCKWPAELQNGDTALAQFFDIMNEKNHDFIEELQRTSCHLITFSHFLPRQELCPEKRMLLYPNLPKMTGSDYLEMRIRSIHGQNLNRSACHVFGHTHFCWDAVLDGIRYVQAPLAYPKERKGWSWMDSGEDWLPFCIYHKGFTDRLSPSYWSDYYSKHNRDPENTDLEPWVAERYRK